MREHLADCVDCSAWYERHLLVASLDPRAASAERRLAAGLGLEAVRSGWTSFSLRVGLAAAAVAVCALLVYSKKPAEFAARGGEQSAGMARVFAYRVQHGQAAEPVGERIRAADELAFAYANPAGFKRLMIFGVDEHRHVYWYHPAWSNPAENPQAISISAGPEMRELPESVAHELDGKNLKIHSIFTNRDLSVRDVERMLLEQGGAAAPRGGMGSFAATLGDASASELSLVVE